MRNVSAEEIILQIDGGVYYMISSPYMPEDRDPQVSLEDDLGPYNETQWRFFRYDTADSKYAELKSPDWDPEKHDFDFGRGYWIISTDPKEISIQGEPIAKNWIILEHEGDGWNQIGNIFGSDFPIVRLYVARVSDPRNPVQLIDPINNDLTYVTLQAFENDSYIDIPTIGKGNLEVGKSYWLRVREGVGEDVYLGFMATGSSAQSEEILLSEEFFARVSQQGSPPDPPPGMGSSSGSVSSGSGSGGCFIATAAYGDYDHPNVRLLRKFRDRYLLTSSFGRMFVDMYYHHSPIVTGYIAKHTPIKALIRFTLMPIIAITAFFSKMNVSGFLIILAFPILMGFFFLIKSVEGGGRCKPRFSIKSEEGKRKR
jgi:hypothetical protein